VGTELEELNKQAEEAAIAAQTAAALPPPVEFLAAEPSDQIM